VAFIVDVPEPAPRSALPAGGAPADDAAYLAWRNDYLDYVNGVAIALGWHDVPEWPADPVTAHRLDAELYDALGGVLPLFNEPINYSHRLRFLGVALRTRRRDVASHACRIASRLAAEVV
jgi:hypothetical protein